MSREKLKQAVEGGQEVIIHKHFSGTVKAFDEAKRTAQFVISTGSVDRDNDTINPGGWVLTSFLKNPVVLWAHNSSLPPIGKAIEIKTRGAGRNKKLVATAQFAKRDQHELADTVFQLIVGGFLNATSVGFQPIDMEFNGERNGFDFKAQELHEFSVVPVPANPEAVLTAAKEKGLDINPVIKWAEYTLDHFKQKETEVLYKLVKAPVKQVDMGDLPEEVSQVIEMIEMDLPGIKDALAHAVSEDAETITTFEGAGDAIEPLPQADGDDGIDPDLTEGELDQADDGQAPDTQELDILESDPADSSLGELELDTELQNMNPEDLKLALTTEVKLQVAAVTGKLPE